MVYDEGFEIRLADMNFFAFSKYSIGDGRVNYLSKYLNNYMKIDT